MTFQARGGAKILRGGAKQSQGRCAPPPKIRPWFRVRNFYQSCEVLAFTRFCNALYTFLQPYPPSFETMHGFSVGITVCIKNWFRSYWYIHNIKLQ
jgi:hypothetical protein